MIRPPAPPVVRPAQNSGPPLIPGEPAPPPVPGPDPFDPGPFAPETLSPLPTPGLSPSTAGTIVVGDKDAADRWNAMVERFRAADMEAQARAITNNDGIFYRSAPLGWEAAGRYVRVPARGDQPETVLWQLDPTARPLTPTGTLPIPSEVLDERGARRQLFNMDLTTQELVKSQLLQTGLITREQLGPSGVRFLSEPIQKAWIELVGIAQSNGFQPQSFLSEAARSGIRFRPDTTPRAPAIRVSDPDDIKQAANAIAQREIGRRLTPEELDFVVQPYQQREAQAQRRMLGGGTVAQAPSIDTFTTGVIEEQAEEEQALYSLGATLDNFMGMLGGR